MNNINGTGHNLLEKYHLITDTDVEAAHRNRIDPRARQNARAFYHCLKSTLEGDIRSTLFDQLANTPTVEDGATLFMRITKFSLASSLQMTIKA
eukprot:scaffold17784_cov76-Cylindrotheca_fusiformis.AAC.1